MTALTSPPGDRIDPAAAAAAAAPAAAQPFQPRHDPAPSPASPEQRAAALADPGFGRHFTDHMVLADWTPEFGWHDARVVPRGPLQLDPAAAVLHYAQEIFEGLKAYRHPDGSVWTFRPEQNAARFQRSAARLMMPELPIDWFVGAVDALVRADEAWVPDGRETSLYLRPFMFGSEAFLGVRAARRYTFCVIASPAAGYFDGGPSALSLWLSQTYTRAGEGGTGAAKCGGNYAASLLPLAEAAAAGCDQVVFLDAAERDYVEELGGMNLFFVLDDGEILTPASDSILDGIVKNSLKELGADLGHRVTERPVSLREWRDGVASGRIAEVFACGTAAVIAPVGRLVWADGELSMGPDGGGAGPVTTALRRALVDLHHGRAVDARGWLRRVSA